MARGAATTARTRDPDDLRAFARRNWAAIARAKKTSGALDTPAERLRLGAALWEHARALHPSWPTDADRDADLAHHLRVSDALRRVPPRGR